MTPVVHPVITLTRNRVTIQLGQHPSYEKMRWELAGIEGLLRFRQYWAPLLSDGELVDLLAELGRWGIAHALNWPAVPEQT